MGRLFITKQKEKQMDYEQKILSLEEDLCDALEKNANFQPQISALEGEIRELKYQNDVLKHRIQELEAAQPLAE